MHEFLKHPAIGVAVAVASSLMIFSSKYGALSAQVLEQGHRLDGAATKDQVDDLRARLIRIEGYLVHIKGE